MGKESDKVADEGEYRTKVKFHIPTVRLTPNNLHLLKYRYKLTFGNMVTLTANDCGLDPDDVRAVLTSFLKVLTSQLVVGKRIYLKTLRMQIVARRGAAKLLMWPSLSMQRVIDEWWGGNRWRYLPVTDSTYIAKFDSNGVWKQDKAKKVTPAVRNEFVRLCKYLEAAGELSPSAQGARYMIGAEKKPRDRLVAACEAKHLKLFKMDPRRPIRDQRNEILARKPLGPQFEQPGRENQGMPVELPMDVEST